MALDAKQQSVESSSKFLNNLDSAFDIFKTVVQLSEEELNSGDNKAFNKFLALYRNNCEFKKLTRTSFLELVSSLSSLFIIIRSRNCINTFDNASALLSGVKSIVDIRRILQIYNSNDEKDLGEAEIMFAGKR